MVIAGKLTLTTKQKPSVIVMEKLTVHGPDLLKLVDILENESGYGRFTLKGFSDSDWIESEDGSVYNGTINNGFSLLSKVVRNGKPIWAIHFFIWAAQPSNGSTLTESDLEKAWSSNSADIAVVGDPPKWVIKDLERKLRSIR